MKISSPKFTRIFLAKSLSIKGDYISLLFAGLSIFSGGIAAIVGGELGWIALLAVPVLIYFVAILISPELGLASFVFIIFAQVTLVLTTYHRGIPSPALPLLGALYFLILWRLVALGDRPKGWQRTIIILILVGCWLISALVAEDSTLALAKFQKFTENASLALVVLFFVQRPASLRLIILTLLVVGVFMATLTLIQNLTSNFNTQYWGFAQWDYASTDGVTNRRAAGPYGNPNAYAQVLVMLVPLALDRLWHEKDLRFRLFAGWALFVCVLAIFFSYSRNGFITLIFTLGFLVVMRRPRFMALVLTAVLVVIFLQFLPSKYLDRISTIFQFSSSTSLSSQLVDVSFRGRLSENTAAWRMFLDNPLFGVGLDNFQINYQDYSRKIGLDNRRVERAPASFYLELLSEQGLIGTTVFLVFIILVFRSLWKANLRFELFGMSDEKNITLAFIAGLSGYMFFYISKNSAYSNVFWILIGIAFSISQIAENSAYLQKNKRQVVNNKQTSD